MEQVSKTVTAQMNDLFRQSMITTNTTKAVLTEGVANSPYREEIITAVREFNTFTEDNDPYGEHDFGMFIVNGKKCNWKIDYYDLQWEYGSDPNQGAVCRLLTVMLAEEY